MKIRSWSLRPPYCLLGAPSWIVAKERATCVGGVRWPQFDERRLAAEDTGKPQAGRWAMVEVDGTAARDIIFSMGRSNWATARCGRLQWSRLSGRKERLSTGERRIDFLEAGHYHWPVMQHVTLEPLWSSSSSEYILRSSELDGLLKCLGKRIRIKSEPLAKFLQMSHINMVVSNHFLIDDWPMQLFLRELSQSTFK